MVKKKVIILGGGIGGLSAAHELAKRKDEFDVTVIEQTNCLGGQAAEDITKMSKNTNAICYLIITNHHKYFLSILDELHDENGEKITQHLKFINKLVYNLQNRNHIDYNNSIVTNKFNIFILLFEGIYKKKMLKKDIFKLYCLYTYANLISEERMVTYTSILWKNYINNLSTELRCWLLYFTSIYLNMDYNKVSTYFVFKLMRNRQLSNITNSPKEANKFYTFDGPILPTLFTPWQKHLESNGVKFLLNCKVNHIYHTPPLTTVSTININCNQIESTLTADIFINALDSKNLANLYPLHNKFMELHNSSLCVQNKLLFYLPYKITKKNKPIIIMVFPKTLWFVSIRIIENLWETEKFNYIMCSVCIWDKPGTMGKTATECSKAELAIECWKQIQMTNHDLLLQAAVPQWSIWDSFQFDAELNEIITIEPRFSNNISVDTLRPSYVDANLINLYHATSYTKTSTNIYNIESAAEAGIKAAKIICDVQDRLRLQQSKKNFYVEKIIQPPTTLPKRICRTIDKYIFVISEIYK